MGYLLFIVYLVFFSWLLTRIRFIKNGGLSSKIIIALFLIKVGAGLLAGSISESHPDSDSWAYHRESVKEYKLLFTQPAAYFSNLFYSGYSDGHNGLLRFKDSYWNDLKDNLVIKIFSVLNIFSTGNYYVNVILLNFLIFFGNFGLFRVFNQLYRHCTIQVVMGTFLLPSLVFFGSALHKEGLILAAIGAIVFCTYEWLCNMGLSFKRIIFTIFSILFIFLLRNYVAMALLPALLAWIIADRKKYSPLITFLVIYTVSALLFFNVQLIFPGINLPQNIVQRQSDFVEIGHGNTYIGVPALNPGFISFLLAVPAALAHVLFRPFLTDISMSGLLLPLSAELFVYQLLFILLLFFRKKHQVVNGAFLWFSIFFSLSVLLLIGYIVPVIGAFARYRSIYLPFLLTPLFCAVDWSAILAKIQIKK